jgi:hypothetical protein
MNISWNKQNAKNTQNEKNTRADCKKGQKDRVWAPVKNTQGRILITKNLRIVLLLNLNLLTNRKIPENALNCVQSINGKSLLSKVNTHRGNTCVTLEVIHQNTTTLEMQCPHIGRVENTVPILQKIGSYMHHTAVSIHEMDLVTPITLAIEGV